MSDNQEHEEIAGPCGSGDDEALAEVEAMPEHYGEDAYEEEKT